MNFHVEPFDVERTFAKAVLLKEKQKTKYRGPDAPLYSAIYPLFFITKIFGLAPYHFTRDRLTPSFLSLVFSFIFLSIYGYIMYIVFLRFTGVKRDQPVLGGTETAKVILNFFVATYDIIFTMFTSSKFVSIWNALQDYDENVKHLGYPRKELRVRVVAFFFLILQSAIWITVNQTGMMAFMEPWHYNVSYMIPYIGTAVSVHKFVGIAYLLGQRFRQLNQIAIENLPLRHGSRSTNIREKTIEDLHNELMVAGEALNSLYSLSLLLWLLNLSMHSVSNIYFLINWVFVPTWGDVAWPLISCLLSWLVSFIWQLLILHLACDYTSTQANYMGQIITEWMVRASRRNPRDNTKITSLHFLNRKLDFSAGGCFNVDVSLIRSIIGVLSTYLIILLQFN